MKKNSSGQVIVVVLIVLVLISLFVPVLVNFVQQESRWAVKEKKSAIAFNIAEAGIERGIWKLKESTCTFNMASHNIQIAGYHYDKTYSDIEGGFYRINFTSGASINEVIIYAEGKDSNNNETRAIKCIVKNQTIPGAIISKGVINFRNALEVHWGPVMSHGNIVIETGAAAQDFFPRKFSKQVVICNQSSMERDTNGIDPPNTDNIEWWSDYDVPDLPVLDFAALKSSATATNTCNVFGCSKMSAAAKSALGITAWWGSSTCNISGKNHDGLHHFQTPFKHPDARKGYVWYWDNGDVMFTGSTGADGCGIIGNIIVKNNLTNYCGDNMYSTSQPGNPGIGLGTVPSEAWKEYTIIRKTGATSVVDTAAKNQYPADDGYKKNRTTFNFGGEAWTDTQSPPSAGDTDIGVEGFMYIGGNYSMEGPMDIYGAIWCVGDITKQPGAERAIVFFNENLDLPTLNVVLVKKSWEEIQPNSTPWQ